MMHIPATQEELQVPRHVVAKRFAKLI